MFDNIVLRNSDQGNVTLGAIAEALLFYRNTRLIVGHGLLVSLGSMPFCVELDNLKDTDAPIHQPAAMLVAAD